MKLKTLVLATAALFAANTMAADDLVSTTQGEIQFNASFVESICTVTVNDTNILGADGTEIDVAQIAMGAYDITPLNAAAGTNTASTPVVINFSNCPAGTTIYYAFTGENSGNNNLFGVGGTTNNENLGLYIATSEVTAGSTGTTDFLQNSLENPTQSVDINASKVGEDTVYVGYQSLTTAVGAEKDSVTTVTLNVIY